MDLFTSNKKVISKCKRKQLNLIKDNANSHRERSFCKNIIFDNHNLSSMFKNDLYNRYKFNVAKTKYEKHNKAAYIVNDKHHNKYFIKIKSSEFKVEDELIIFDKMKNLHHENIIQFIDYKESNNTFYFIYEFIEGKNLLEYVKGSYNLKFEIMLNLFSQLLNAVHFLHNNKIIHCDLKLENIMVSDDKVKIIDFDLAKYCPEKLELVSNDIFGTDKYIAPESYDLGIYSAKSDVWGLGIILYILITKKYPYEESLSFDNQGSNLYRRNQFKHIDFGILRRKILEKNGDLKYYELIINMLKFNDEERISVQEIQKYLK